MSEHDFPSRWPRDARIECANRDKRIEELEDCSHIDFEARDEYLKRIEELEEKAEFWKMKAIGSSMGHRITTDQIRAAWRDAIFATRPDEEQTEFLEARQLGIVGCEGCGGNRIVPDPTDDRIANKCPDCNGEGFKIGEKK